MRESRGAGAACAHLQDRFWPFHDRIFEKGHEYPVNQLEPDAQALGLDMTRFRECLASGQGMELVKKDIAEAGPLGVRSTPTYVVNGIRIAGRHGVCAKLSSDDGKTWSGPVRLAQSLSPDCGYPSSVQLDNGNIVTAYYSRQAPEYAGYHMGVAVWTAP